MCDVKLSRLRALMETRKIDAYYISSSDFHASEYVGDYFRSCRFLTGFTGSACEVVVTMDWAGVWTDGRYFVQAEQELADGQFQLMRMGEPGVPTVVEFLASHLKPGGVLGFDGRAVTIASALEMQRKLSGKNIGSYIQEDLIDLIWSDRPSLPAEPIWPLEIKYAGISTAEKQGWLREMLVKQGITVQLITVLDEIAWLLNLRGNDISFNPVFLADMIVTQDEIILFVQRQALSSMLEAYLEENQITLCEYGAFSSVVEGLRNETILLEHQKTGFGIYECIHASNTIRDEMSPVALAKARKNPVELQNMKAAHVKDGVAVTRFMYWLKHNIGRVSMTEYSVSEKLEEFRSQQNGYIEPSFATIVAYAEHGAMCHYHASSQGSKALEPQHMLLVDSGGHYYEGTTDITRTVALGPLSQREKYFFTLVATSMLKAEDIKFPQGCTGLTLDYAVRSSMWAQGLDYNHGTGHGVGYLTSVHERPNGIRWKVVPERQDSCVWEVGMISSVEPGIYLDGELGVRIENLVVCQERETTPFGRFLGFDYLTFVPIDREGLDCSLMTSDDIRRLNDYHRRVYDRIAPHLDEEESAWLAEVTAAIGE